MRGLSSQLTAIFLTPSLMGTCFASNSLGKSLITQLGRSTFVPNSLHDTGVLNQESAVNISQASPAQWCEGSGNAYLRHSATMSRAAMTTLGVLFSYAVAMCSCMWEVASESSAGHA